MMDDGSFAVLSKDGEKYLWWGCGQAVVVVVVVVVVLYHALCNNNMLMNPSIAY